MKKPTKEVIYSKLGQDALDAHLYRVSWLTLPRVLMNAMPDEWQQKMADLIDEYNNAFDWEKVDGFNTYVQGKRNGKFIRIPDWLSNYRHPDRDFINSIKRVKEHE